MADKNTMKTIIEKDWNENPRWKGIKRPYSSDEVVNLKGSVNIEYTLAKNGANKFWNLLTTTNEPISALGALTGNQAIQEIQAKHGFPILSIISMKNIMDYVGNNQAYQKYMPKFSAYREQYGVKD